MSEVPLSVHRCRFVDYTPSAITSIAFPPLPLPRLKQKNVPTASRSKKFGTLAVGRNNGNIELYEWTGGEHDDQAPQAWVLQKILLGPTPSKVDSLVFTIRYPHLVPDGTAPKLSDLRLFSAGGGSELVEWDLDRGCVLRTIGSQAGAIWSMSANPSGTLLALGCEDGSVKLLSLENNILEHYRRLDRIKCRLLSVAWGPPTPPQVSKPASNNDSDSDDEDDEWKDSWLIAGCSDSSLRKWDIASGRVLERMTTDKQRGERTLVWTVGVLGDGTIFSGDSLGMVKIWDPITCTQLFSFQAHGADVLCLAIGPDGESFFTSGVDQKVCMFSHVKMDTQGKSALQRSSRWIQSTSKRMHSHDVRSIAVWPPYLPVVKNRLRRYNGGVAPLLASGGLDMSVVLTPCVAGLEGNTKLVNPLSTSTHSSFEDAYHRRVAYPSGIQGCIRLARSARLLLCMHDRSATIWRITKAPGKIDEIPDPAVPESSENGYEEVLHMDLKTLTNLSTCTISDDGCWVAFADYYSVKLFELRAEGMDLRAHRVKEFNDAMKGVSASPVGATSLCFSPDSSKLIVATTQSSLVLVIDVGSSEGGLRILRQFNQHRSPASGLRATKGLPGAADGMDVSDAGSADGQESDAEDELGDRALVTFMAFSPDGQWLVTTDDHCRTHVFNMDAIQHHCIIPSTPVRVVALSFDPASPATLVMGLANNTIEIFDVEQRQFPSWSRELCRNIPRRFKQLHDPILGVAFDSAGGQEGTEKSRHALFWGSTWLCRVGLDAPVGYGGFSKKRRRAKSKDARAQQGIVNGDVAPEKSQAQDQEETNFKLVTRYRPILFADFLVKSELVIVERPLVDVLATLPPAYFRPKYGT